MWPVTVMGNIYVPFMISLFFLSTKNTLGTIQSLVGACTQTGFRFTEGVSTIFRLSLWRLSFIQNCSIVERVLNPSSITSTTIRCCFCLFRRKTNRLMDKCSLTNRTFMWHCGFSVGRRKLSSFLKAQMCGKEQQWLHMIWFFSLHHLLIIHDLYQILFILYTDYASGPRPPGRWPAPTHRTVGTYLRPTFFFYL